MRFTVLASCLLLSSACAFDTGLESDPAYWNPAALSFPGDVDSGEVPGARVPAACSEETPPFVAELEVSGKDTLSHLAGTLCLEGCHEAGGTARKTFATAGTLYEVQGSRTVATWGTVFGVGGTALEVDPCGNIYATAEALSAPVTSTRPWVEAPYHLMTPGLAGKRLPGSCNQARCHDFGGALTQGVYFCSRKEGPGCRRSR